MTFALKYPDGCCGASTWSPSVVPGAATLPRACDERFVPAWTGFAGSTLADFLSGTADFAADFAADLGAVLACSPPVEMLAPAAGIVSKPRTLTHGYGGWACTRSASDVPPEWTLARA